MSVSSDVKKREWADKVLDYLVEFGFGPKDRAKHLFDRHTDKVIRLCWAVKESPRLTAQHVIERESFVLRVNAAKSRRASTKTCDHCGKDCVTRVAVVLPDGSVADVGSVCAQRFKRARASDLIRPRTVRRPHMTRSSVTEGVAVGVSGLTFVEKLKKAEKKDTPPSVLHALVGVRDLTLCILVAKNPSAPPEALKKMASDENGYVRGLVAKHANTPPKSLAKLATDRESLVRYGVAQNTSTPAGSYSKLVNDEDYDTRVAAVQRAVQLLSRDLRRAYESVRSIDEKQARAFLAVAMGKMGRKS